MKYWGNLTLTYCRLVYVNLHLDTAINKTENGLVYQPDISQLECLCIFVLLNMWPCCCILQTSMQDWQQCPANAFWKRTKYQRTIPGVSKQTWPWALCWYNNTMCYFLHNVCCFETLDLHILKAIAHLKFASKIFALSINTTSCCFNLHTAYKKNRTRIYFLHFSHP